MERGFFFRETCFWRGTYFSRGMYFSTGWWGTYFGKATCFPKGNCFWRGAYLFEKERNFGGKMRIFEGVEHIVHSKISITLYLFP